MIPTNPELRQFIMQYFSDEELEILCFDYFPEVSADFGGGMTKSRKAIALIGYSERRGRLGDLRAALARERPEAWNGQFAAAEIKKPGFFGETRFLNERDPRQIFLSHATADAEFAHALADDLRAEGWRVWIAPDSIRAGEKWVEAIDRGLETSGVFLVVLTPDAVASSWVNTETNAAVGMQHEGLIEFIPLDRVACQPKRLWRQYQYVPFRESYEAGLDALLRRLDGGIFGGGAGATEVAYYEQRKKPDRRIHEKTGIELIRIPAGPFLYGDDKREIELPEYWIGRGPVTNAQFARFVQAVGYRTTAEQQGYGWAWTGEKWGQVKGAGWRHPRGPESSIDGKDDHPVVQVSWDDAKAFGDWAGLALPTEEEWEKAARGTDGRVWPWGNDEPTDKHCNFNSNVGDTTPAGRYSPLGDSPYGCADMAGNVWEWTATADEARRVLRGGSWRSNQNCARAVYRSYYHPNNRYNDVGCRLVRRPPSQAL